MHMQVLSSKLHKLWRRFDRTIMQAIFGGRDMRMPNYFHSVAELNQRILRVQDTSGSLPVSSMIPRHVSDMQQYPVLESATSTETSVHTNDFRDSVYNQLSGVCAEHVALWMAAVFEGT
jgi:hypothetical protein